MMSLRNRLASLCLSPLATPLLLALVAVLAYGLLFRSLGFYWDEWPMTWIAHKLGPEGLARYFATNRPYWGMIYQVTTGLLGDAPWRWQLFGLFWRWVTAAALWATLRQVWPRRTDAALFASLLFLVYPGFSQQSIAMMFGHFFVVLSAYVLSLACSLGAALAWGRRPARFVLLTALALLLALVNLLAMEYFFLLELLRPGFLFLALWNRDRLEAQEQGNPLPPARSVLARTGLHELPYLAVFLGAAAWRVFFFPYQNQNYSFGLIPALKADPLGTIAGLAARVAIDIAQTTTGAWARAFSIPDVKTLGLRSLAFSGAVALVVLAAAAVFLLLVRARPGERRGRQGWAGQALLLGLAGLVLAGPPFWLTGLPLQLGYPNDRFTLPFMLGASLIAAGLLALLPGRRAYKVALLSVLVAAAAGLHARESISFQRDWNAQKILFWQMSWRIPALQAGTTLISSDLPMQYYSDNSLTGPLNWIYAPDNHSQQMAYMFYFASVRAELHALLQPGQPIRQDYLASRFDGSTDQMVAVVYHPPACLRVLDPQIDPANTMLPELMRESAKLSGAQWIQPSGAPDLTPAIFGAEPARGWCYYFEKADLARQQQDWAAVAKLGDEAFALKDYPNDPMERLPFIEGYAHTGRIDRARELTGESLRITALMKTPICELWARIGQTASEGQAVLKELECGG